MNATLNAIRTGKEKIAVSLYGHGREVEYTLCTLAQARELLATKTAKGFSYRVSDWQFDEDGGTPQDELWSCVSEARRIIFAKETAGA